MAERLLAPQEGLYCTELVKFMLYILLTMGHRRCMDRWYLKTTFRCLI